MFSGLVHREICTRTVFMVGQGNMVVWPGRREAGLDGRVLMVRVLTVQYGPELLIKQRSMLSRRKPISINI